MSAAILKINDLFLEILAASPGYINQPHWISLDLLLISQKVIWSSSFRDRSSECKYRGKETALLIGRLKWSHWQAEFRGLFFSNWSKKSLQKMCGFQENANSFKYIICFPRNLNYFKFQHLTVSGSENRYLILNLAYLWQLSYLLTCQTLNCGAVEAEKWRLI